jgi:hypothetical protein
MTRCIRRLHVAAVLLVLVASCHRRPAAPAPIARGLLEDYCWWTAFRTPLPLDTVGVRFVRSYAGAGFTGAAWSRIGDTVLAHAGPTVLEREGGAHEMAARMVAFRRGDSTLFRHYLSLMVDSTSRNREGALRIGLCSEIGRGSQTHATAPARPGSEDSLLVWSRR